MPHIDLRIPVLALALTAPFAAEAQGGLLKRAKDKAQNAVAREAGIGGQQGRQPTFGENVLEITPARVDQLMKGLDAQAAGARQLAARQTAEDRAFADRQRAYEAELRVYQAKKQKYDSIQTAYGAYSQCVGTAMAAQGPNAAAMQMAQRMQSMSPAEREEMQKKINALQQRAQAAERRGDRATQALLADSIRMAAGMSRADVSALTSGGAGQSAMQKCGQPSPALMQAATQPAPVPPQEPVRASADSLARLAALDSIAASGAGLTLRQFGVLRERAAAFVAYGDDITKHGPWAYSRQELEVLRGARERLARYGDALTGDYVIGWDLEVRHGRDH